MEGAGKVTPLIVVWVDVKTGSTPELSLERLKISVRRDLSSATWRGALGSEGTVFILQRWTGFVMEKWS